MSIAVTLALLQGDGTPDAGAVVAALSDQLAYLKLVGGVLTPGDWLPPTAVADATGTAVLHVPAPSEVYPPRAGWTIRFGPGVYLYGHFPLAATGPYTLTDLITTLGWVPVLAPVGQPDLFP